MFYECSRAQLSESVVDGSTVLKALKRAAELVMIVLGVVNSLELEYYSCNTVVGVMKSPAE